MLARSSLLAAVLAFAFVLFVAEADAAVIVLNRADSPSQNPPPLCSSACSSLISSLSSCKLSTSVTKPSTAASSLATCACPFFAGDSTCDACLLANASTDSATSLFTTLVANCKVSTAKAASTIESLLSSSSSSATSTSTTPSGAVLRDGANSAATPARDASVFVVIATISLGGLVALLA